MATCLNVCGEIITVPEGLRTLQDVMQHLGHDKINSIAIAHKGVVVPRALWQQTIISQNDDIEIVRPVFGG